MNGGKYDGKKQKAIVEFICIRQSEERRTMYGVSTAEDEDRSGEETDDEHGGKIKILSWLDEEEAKVLRLQWDTQYACEDAKDGGGSSSSGHWGFFTWFILMCVLPMIRPSWQHC